MLGLGDQLGIAERTIPNYSSWSEGRLQGQIKLLHESLAEIAKHLLLETEFTPNGIDWCAERFDKWAASGTGIFELGTVQGVERAIGTLGFRRLMECPPYAQVVVQGFVGAAIRHPEYHLGSDLALLWNLFKDAERIRNAAMRANLPASSEHSQSLGRSVIITCFNLLESFVSGLAVEWKMSNPEADSSKLPDSMSPLQKRFFAVPATILGVNEAVARDDAVIAELFGDIKRRRDAFVHCEPGDRVTKYGHVKEQQFHEIDTAVVKRTVDLTLSAIRIVWKVVHQREGPLWLPSLDASGYFPRVNLHLQSEAKRAPTAAQS